MTLTIDNEDEKAAVIDGLTAILTWYVPDGYTPTGWANILKAAEILLERATQPEPTDDES